MEIQAQETAERWAPPWWAVFLCGLLLWGATIAVARVTQNIILLPTIVLLGSFLVPITAVVGYLDQVCWRPLVMGCGPRSSAARSLPPPVPAAFVSPG